MWISSRLAEEARSARAAAVRLRAVALTVERSRQLPWTSVAADRFRDCAAVRVRRLRAVAEACDDAARAADRAVGMIVDRER